MLVISLDVGPVATVMFIDIRGFTAMSENMNPEEVPLLAGELVHADQKGRCAGFNEIMAKLPETLPNSHVISSAGCTTGDRLHFDSAGSRELGKRYGEKMLSLLGGDEVHPSSSGAKAE